MGRERKGKGVTITYQGTEYAVTPAHPAADALPWHLDRPAFAELVDNIRRVGFDPARPVLRHADVGLVIGGRRRELAALVAGVAPVYKDVRWDDDAITRWVIQEDLLRRDLTPSERAAAAVALADLLPRGSNQYRSRAHGECSPCARSAAEIAAEAGVDKKTIAAAAKVKKQAPELLPAVKEGKISASMAARAADLAEGERKEIASAREPKKAARERLARRRSGELGAECECECEDKPISRIPASSPSSSSHPHALDDWGLPIQEHAREAFAAIPRFHELIRAIQHAQRLFNEVANLPGGIFLTLPDVSSYRRGKPLADGTHADRFVHTGLEEALRQVKAAMPAHTVCPYQYADKPHPDPCGTCRGLNWTPALSDSVPKVCVERAKEAHGVGDVGGMTSGE